MSIHFISGKPGGGKTLYSVRWIIDELKNTQRQIITNVSLDLDRLQDYVHELGIEVHVLERVRILDEAETKRFFLFRAVDLVLDDPLTAEQIDFGPSVDHPRAKHGVSYFIDEVQLHFGSRDWAKTGKLPLFYLSQHRKLGDLVVFITQSIQNVDKQFRSLAQDFSYVRNHRVEKFGLFRIGDGFSIKTYLSPVTNGNEVPCEVAKFDLDVTGLCSCYQTAAGVGMPGVGQADAGRKVKGVPLWLLWPGLAAALLLFGAGVWLVPKWLAGAAGSMLAPPKAVTKSAPAAGQPSANLPGQSVAAQAVAGMMQTPPPASGAAGQPGAVAPPLQVRGLYVAARGEVRAWLSDGRRITARTPGLEQVDEDGIVLDGVRVEFAPPAEPTGTAAQGRIAAEPWPKDS